MSVTLDVSDQLAELLQALAARRGVSVEELGQQALAVGLTTLASAGSVVDLGAARSPSASEAVVQMPSPVLVSGSVRPLAVTFEPEPEASSDAH